MTILTHRLIKWGGLIGEIWILPMLYSATLLAPGPFGWVRLSVIGTTAAASFAFAFLSSSRFKDPSHSQRLPLKELLAKPPSVIWFTVVAIITLQLADGLYMLYLVDKRG